METKLASSPEHQSRISSHDGINIMHTSTPKHSQTISTPSMKAMVPLPMDETFQHSSSTESAHDQQESKCPETPKRSKPSKIPLTKGFVAKPPSGRTSATNGPPSNKSLTKSTGSLYLKSTGPSSINKKDSSLTRPDSVQSWRNMSFDGNKSRSSSIPISNKPVLSVASSPVSSSPSPAITIVNIPSSKYVASSPLPRHKRDSLTTKVKNLDSLSRLQSSSTGALANSVVQQRSPPIVNGNGRKYTALPVRRMSNVSAGRDDSQADGETVNGGKVRNIRSSIWNWLKI
jgi:hypothetical protein